MRLLQVSLRSLLLYSLIVVIVSIPVSIIAIREILDEENDETLKVQANEFLKHIKGFEYLDDLETDLEVLDQLSHDIHVIPWSGSKIKNEFETLVEYDSIEQENQPIRQFSTMVDIKGKPYLLTVHLSLLDNNELIVAITSVQAILVIILAGGLLLLNRSLNKRLWKPFYHTLDQLKAYELDKNEAIKTQHTNIIEFSDLNKTITNLADRNRKIFLQQKEFIENASHELQTPLAIFQSRLDILMQKPGLSEAEATAIHDLESTAQRMSRLNKNLLLLSKIDNEQFGDKEEIELSDLIKNLIQNLIPFAKVGLIKITSVLEPTRIFANKALIEILLTNLLHNAIRHSATEGIVSVILTGNKLSITNSGKPLKINAEHMFDRFNKGISHPESTGLGLAIVKKVCDSSGFKLAYHYSEPIHNFFIIF